MAGLLRDTRFAVRQLRRNLGFTIAATVILAVAICANSTVFSWINGTMLHPIPGARHTDELVSVMRGEWSTSPTPPLSYLDYRDLRDQNHSLTGMSVLVCLQRVRWRYGNMQDFMQRVLRDRCSFPVFFFSLDYCSANPFPGLPSQRRRPVARDPGFVGLYSQLERQPGKRRSVFGLYGGQLEPIPGKPLSSSMLGGVWSRACVLKKSIAGHAD